MSILRLLYPRTVTHDTVNFAEKSAKAPNQMQNELL
jgi:hypothetical protein